jgi:hypothetical protein
MSAIKNVNSSDGSGVTRASIADARAHENRDRDHVANVRLIVN